ncbi:MAG: divalent-cation tolerance protein CutA [Chloroflexota bacterium]
MKPLSTDYSVVFITAASFEEAELISQALLAERKVACVSIVREVSSHFWWQGGIKEAKESLLIAKTRSSELDGIIEMVKGIHSYDIPEIIALPLVYGNPDYLDWLDKELEGGGS